MRAAPGNFTASERIAAGVSHRVRPGCNSNECNIRGECCYPSACRALALLSEAGRSGFAKVERAHRDAQPPPLQTPRGLWSDLPPGPVMLTSLEAMIASAPSRRGRWRQSYTGRPIWPLDPRPGDFAIADLAHHLANINRYGGAARRNYSVAEHSVLVSVYGDPAFARHKLTHDLGEAITGLDMGSPIKSDPAMVVWRAVEDRCQAAVWRQLDLDPEQTGDTHAIDLAILHDERAVLMAEPPMPWGIGGKGLGAWVWGLPALEAERLFLYRFLELFPEHAAETVAALEAVS